MGCLYFLGLVIVIKFLILLIAILNPSMIQDPRKMRYLNESASTEQKDVFSSVYSMFGIYFIEDFRFIAIAASVLSEFGICL